MAVTTTQTNKPINPRGNDQSPKGYNRAELYTGKALDFDGVNDVLDLSSTITLTDFSLCAYIDKSSVETAGIFSNSDGTDAIMFRSNSANDFRIRINSNNNNISLDDDGVYDDGLNFWVFIREDANFYIYKNGHKVAESSSVQTNDFEVSKIGAQGTTNFLTSAVSGAKIFNTALTAAQVADLYNNPEKVVPTGVDNTALKLWLPMQEGAGTTAFNGAPDALGSELVTNGDFATDSDWSKTGDWEISGGSANSDGTTSISNLSQNITFEVGKTYRYSFTISNRTQGGVRAYIGAATGVLNESNGIVTGSIVYSSGTSFVLQSRNNFIGSVDNVSIKEENNFGTISGATWTHGIGAPVAQTAVIDWNKVIDPTYEYLIPQGLTSGRDLLGNLFENVRKQGALNLDGNSWAEVHDNASLDITDAITLEAWVYWDNSTDKGLMGKWESANNQKAYLLYQTSNEFRMYISSNGSLADFQGSTGSPSIGWNHLVGTYDGANIKLYLNGAFDSSKANASGLNATNLNLEIGRHETQTSSQLNAPIAQPRIYNRALTAEEVERNYNAGKNIYK